MRYRNVPAYKTTQHESDENLFGLDLWLMNGPWSNLLWRSPNCTQSDLKWADVLIMEMSTKKYVYVLYCVLESDPFSGPFGNRDVSSRLMLFLLITGSYL